MHQKATQFLISGPKDYVKLQKQNVFLQVIQMLSVVGHKTLCIASPLSEALNGNSNSGFHAVSKKNNILAPFTKIFRNLMYIYAEYNILSNYTVL